MRLNRSTLLLALGLLIAPWSARAQPAATAPASVASRPAKSLLPSLPIHLPLALPITISGNTAGVTISLGGLSLDLSLGFEQVTNLDPSSLGISARIANPLELAGRMPAGVVPALPLVFAIEPPPSGGLDFHGVVTTNIHTHDLVYTLGTPLRLYSAPIGGNFTDITTMTGTGSYRACGSKGGFSEFVIVADLRSLDDAVGQKFAAVQGLLDEYASSIPPDVLTTLQGQLDAAHDAWSARDYRTAAEAMESFDATVRAHSGAGGIPDEWRAARDLTNVAGYLRAAAGTLRYSLVLGE